VDASQSVPHMKVDVQEIGCDFLFFTGHKVFADSGI
jgi:cysteine desulfurase/selenocysteine lyase